MIKVKNKTYGHILTNSSLDVANPKSLLSVTTLSGSVHLDIAEGAQSSWASISVHKPVKNKFELVHDHASKHCILTLHRKY